LTLHFSGQVTCERIVRASQWHGRGDSKRQVVRLLTAKLETFRAEDEAVLKAGLGGASISRSTTRARACRQEAATHEIGSHNFTTFRTGPSNRGWRFCRGCAAHQ